MRPLPFLLGLSANVITLSLPALAEEPPPEAKELVPYASDEVGHHFQLGMSGGYAAPFGHLAKGVRSAERSGDGWGVLGELGYGFDRYVQLGAYGEYQGLSGSGQCSECRAGSWGAGLFVGYHFAQGLRFDPYISYGIGYRALDSKSGNVDFDYQGIEWLRLAVGGNWYIVPQLGIGPYLQLGGGTMIGLPKDEEVKGSYWRFQLGLRLTLTLPGR